MVTHSVCIRRLALRLLTVARTVWDSSCARPLLRLTRTSSILLCFALNGCVLGNVGMWIQVKQYSGDGVIHNCSVIWWPGYRIEFPKFDSARPYQATYKLNRVPQRGGEPAMLYMCFIQPNYGMALQRQNSVTASFRITLSDQNGRILHSADFQLANTFWGAEQDIFHVFDLEKSKLQLERNASYLLNVFYTPGEIPPPAEELFFFIQNGCSK